MTLNEQLTIAAVSIVDCISTAESNLLDDRTLLKLIDTYFEICSIQTSTYDYIPHDRAFSDSQEVRTEVASILLAYGANFSGEKFLAYKEKLQYICSVDSRIRESFLNCFGSDLSFHDQLNFAESKFGSSARSLLQSIFDQNL